MIRWEPYEIFDMAATEVLKGTVSAVEERSICFPLAVCGYKPQAEKLGFDQD